MCGTHSIWDGALTQLAECHLDVVKVTGSSPVCSTIQYRGVEQLVARRAHNPEVVGSNPSPATIWRRSSGGQSIRFIPEVSAVQIRSPLPDLKMIQPFPSLKRKEGLDIFKYLFRIRIPFF